MSATVQECLLRIVLVTFCGPSPSRAVPNDVSGADLPTLARQQALLQFSLHATSYLSYHLCCMLCLCLMLQLAVLAEFRQDWLTAVSCYQTAYAALRGLPLGSPQVRSRAGGWGGPRGN
jgi:hypothetical protein